MVRKPNLYPHWAAWISLLISSIFTISCVRSSKQGGSGFWSVSQQGTSTPRNVNPGTPEPVWGFTVNRNPGEPILTPTPDTPHQIPLPRTTPEIYTVQAGDTLGLIGSRFGVSLEMIVASNEFANPDILEIGQVLNIPVPTPAERGSDFKIIPDSELVNGPVNVIFDIHDFISKQGGYLASYKEEIGDQSFNGAQIVQRVAQDFSINPRLLLAVLEHNGGWVTKLQPEKKMRDYPIGLVDPHRKGLYRQLTWAANALNRGYYLWRVNGVGVWLLSDGSIVPINPTINAGTAGVQNFFSFLLNRPDWEKAVSPTGLYATFNALFGYPFDYMIEPLLPPALQQPVMQLPFEKGVTWSFTGGPHGGWGDGSAWAALDFGPPGEALGCVPTDAWVVAMADGVAVRAGDGAVLQDIDGDSLEQTGWSILYMHIDSRDRVQPGALLHAGDRIGHPSCEGGVSNGTHVHIARKYNGEWIPADQSIPFILDGWISIGSGKEYDGFLVKNGQSIEAYSGNSPSNSIQR